MSVKQIPLLLLGGMFIGLLVLGAVYFLKSVQILDMNAGLPGSKKKSPFSNTSEEHSLKVVSAKNGMKRVWVYLFSKNKFDQPTNLGYSSPVIRETARSDIVTYALEEIIRGPSPQEVQDGLQTVFGEGEFVAMSGNSNCGGKEFGVDINVDEGSAKVHFCKTLTFMGDAATQILGEMIHKTLVQFEPIQKVQIFDDKGNCFDGTVAMSIEDCEY